MITRALALILVLSVALGLANCSSGPAQQGGPPTAGDCVTLRVWSNGFHTSLAIPAEYLPEDHPLRVLYPQAAHFLTGWGEREYFMDPDPSMFDALSAVLVPNASALQVMAHSMPLEDSLWPATEIISVAVSEDGMDALSRGIADSLEFSSSNEPVVLGGGRLPGRSKFLAARASFHLFHMCNHWTAERLAEAGVQITPGFSFTAGSLLSSVVAKAPAQCPG